MVQGKHIVSLGAALLVMAQCIGWPSVQAQAGGQAATVTGNPAPNPEQIRSLIQRAIDNQHRDDRALEEVERTEHRIARKGENADVITDITERLVPSGSGTVKLKLSENGVAVPPESYRGELEFAVHALDLAIHPNERYNEDLAKFERRRREHDELVDTAEKAFRVTWAGRETRAEPGAPHGSRTFAKFLLDPDPNFKPVNRLAAIFPHCHATLWVDEDAAQFARLEGDVDTDIPFAGGIAGKVYRGGHVVMVQEEEAAGIWLPTLFTFDVEGRKFVMPFGIHERTEITRYRRVGPPPQSIEIMRNELNNLTAGSPAH